ncbi:MAG: hypothetical protein KDE46_00805 [Caldilineaceae bacterium]|nr:hypothetical protein [Caldilineaceae bacterium]
MFLISASTADALFGQLHQTNSEIKCGLLLGKKQGSITHTVPILNVAENPATQLRVEPVQLTSELSRAMQAGLIFQGIYYIDPGAMSMPAPEMIKGWRYNVPCFVVSSKSEGPQISAFALDPILSRASKLLVMVEPSQTTNTRPQATTPQDGVLLGADAQSGEKTILSYQARKLSSYVIGAMGMGKSTLLLNIILSDIARGDGVCVIDPHGDLTDDILCRIPPSRENDIVVWEPFDVARPFGLNLFACEDVTDANLVDQTSSQVVGTFYKLFYDSWGPQMENLLRVTALTLIYNQDMPPEQRPTMVEIPALWNDAAYRAFLVNRVPNPVVREFWHLTYNPLKPADQRDYHKSSINKIDRFILNDTVRNIVGQAESSINLRRIMDERKVFLVNLSKGRLHEDTSGLLGSVLVGKLLTAALSRADIPFAQRPPFHLVVDEYQNFATKTFTTLQTEARKFAIDTIVAHQTRSMLEKESQGATSSVGNLISFAVTGMDAQEIAVMLDNTPPEPPIIGMQPIRTLSTSPWNHLVRNGHTSAWVKQLVLAMQPALTPIPKKNIPNYNHPELSLEFNLRAQVEVLQSQIPINQVRMFVAEEDVRRFEELLNLYLHKRMSGSANGDSQEDLRQLQEIGPYYTSFRYYGSPEYLAVDIGRGTHEFVVFGKDESDTLRKYQNAKQVEFYDCLEKLAQALAQEPILADSGQYEEIRDKPRLYSDVIAETANMLRTLKPYHAVCRIVDEHGNRIQRTIKTYPPIESTIDGETRAKRIREQSRRQYGRRRADVEYEIASRRNLAAAGPASVAPASAQPSQSRQLPEQDSFWEEKVN